jgi:purine-binding chemotaxis protein CheW
MNTPKPSSLVRFIDTPNLIKLIVFPVAQYHFALPIEQVLRVMSNPAMAQSSLAQNSLYELGLIRMNHHLIKVIDLQRQLHSEPDFPSQPQPILVITHNGQGNLYGIPVRQPPDLLEVSPTQIQPLPTPTAYSSLPEIISSALVMPSQAAASVTFLLNLRRVLAGTTANSSDTEEAGVRFLPPPP